MSSRRETGTQEPIMPAGRQQAMKCPVCPKESRGPQGLRAHVRSAHPTHYRIYGIDPLPKPAKRTPPKVLQDYPDAPELETVSAPDIDIDIETVAAPTTEAGVLVRDESPQVLLDRAIGGLQQKKDAALAQITQLQALQQGLASIEAQLNALYAARSVFSAPLSRSSSDEEQPMGAGSAG